MFRDPVSRVLHYIGTWCAVLCFAALAITGELDPVTPPRYGDAVVDHLTDARHLVLAGQGHNVIGAGCMPELFAQFLETADAGALDADCLARLRPAPPFAGHYGWEP